MPTDTCRVLLFGAHPDDAEIFAGGLLVRHRARGSVVRMISVTDGRSGHHQTPPEELVKVRREEARQSGATIGAEYITWDFPDGSLQADLNLRSAIIREIRTFKPDLVLTHRPNDYHPDHRAVGQALQDASYMVTVPHVCPEVPALRYDPVVAYMSDLFTRPNKLRPDVVLDITAELEIIVRMAACHVSQFFEWLPYHEGRANEVPADADARLLWLRGWLVEFIGRRRSHFETTITNLPTSNDLQLIEAYEISEYAAQLTPASKAQLFPNNIS